VSGCADVAILSNIGINGYNAEEERIEIGVSRLLLEAHIPFDRLDVWADFSKYKVLILADDLRPDEALRARLAEFTAKGGKLILSGLSLLKKENDEAAFDLPLTVDGEDREIPNFLEAAPAFAPEGITTPFVMYRPSMKITLSGGTSLGKIYDPYFTRSYEHFCSHQHTPNQLSPSGFEAGCLTENVLYFAHPVFTLYANYGTVILKDFILKAVKALLGDDLQIVTDLPSQGRVSLLEQKEEKRYIFHALYAVPSLRGMSSAPFTEAAIRGTAPVEVIEDLTPVYDTHYEVKTVRPVTKVKLVPENREIPFVYENGRVKFTLEKLQCHQMVEMDY
jgi:hypothetical protein